MKDTFRGAFGIGNSNFIKTRGSYPLATLSLGEKLVLKTSYIIYTKTYSFNPSEVLIKLKYNCFYIIHNEANYPSYICFTPINAIALYNLLRENNVYIEGKPSLVLQFFIKAFHIFFFTFFFIFILAFIAIVGYSIYKS